MLGEHAPCDMEWTSFKERLCAKATQEKEIKLVGYNLSFRACMFFGGRKGPNELCNRSGLGVHIPRPFITN